MLTLSGGRSTRRLEYLLIPKSTANALYSPQIEPYMKPTGEMGYESEYLFFERIRIRTLLARLTYTKRSRRTTIVPRSTLLSTTSNNVFLIHADRKYRKRRPHSTSWNFSFALFFVPYSSNTIRGIRYCRERERRDVCAMLGAVCWCDIRGTGRVRGTNAQVCAEIL